MEVTASTATTTLQRETRQNPFPWYAVDCRTPGRARRDGRLLRVPADGVARTDFSGEAGQAVRLFGDARLPDRMKNSTYLRCFHVFSRPRSITKDEQ